MTGLSFDATPERPRSAGMLLVSAMVAALAVVSFPVTGFGWDYSCSTERTDSFSAVTPQLYMILDESGSMTNDSAPADCSPECEYDIQVDEIVPFRNIEEPLNETDSNSHDSQSLGTYSAGSCSGYSVATAGDYDGISASTENFFYSIGTSQSDARNRLSAEATRTELCSESGDCDDETISGADSDNVCFRSYHNVQVPSDIADGDSVAISASRTSGANGCTVSGSDYNGYSVEAYGAASDDTFSGEVDCPNCSSDSDCETYVDQTVKSHIPACAKSATIETESCDKLKWDIAVDAIKSVSYFFTRTDPNQTHFGLGTFDTNATHQVDIGPDKYQPIADFLDQKSPAGGTDMVDAINMSQNQIASAANGSPQAGMLITDGEHKNDYPEWRVIDAACAHQSTASLYVVGFGDGTDQEFNHAVAAAGGSGSCRDDDGNLVDLCSKSESELRALDEGRDLNCTGAYQANSGTALRNAIVEITNNLSCTIPVSSFGSKYKDPYYCDAPYDCFKIQLPGYNERILYEGKSGVAPADGWSWKNPAQKDEIVLGGNWCQKLVDPTAEASRDVETKLACLCNQTQGAACDFKKYYEDAGGTLSSCECTVGTWSCNESIDECVQTDFSSCSQADLEGAGGSCTIGRGVCENTGEYICSAEGADAQCSVDPKPSNPPEICDGLDNDCDGMVDEDENGDPLTKRGPCDSGNNKGRCGSDLLTCRNGTWECTENRRPMPEICNGLDDDCSGMADDIEASWSSQSWSVSIPSQYEGIACRKLDACVCGDGDADVTHRPTTDQSSVTRQTEFENMLSNTQTGCTCQE